MQGFSRVLRACQGLCGQAVAACPEVACSTSQAATHARNTTHSRKAFSNKIASICRPGLSTSSSSGSSSSTGLQTHWCSQQPPLSFYSRIGALQPLAAAGPTSAIPAAAAAPFGLAAASAAPLLPSAVGACQLQQWRGFQLRPRRTKFRKAFKGQGFNDTICPNTRQLAWGQFGIRAMEHGRIPASTIEATRRALRRTIKKSAALYIRLVPNVPVSSKPAEVRMGKGKGAVEYFAAVVRPGQIMFELDNVNRKLALDALAAAQPKLPFRVGFVEWR